MGTPAIPNLGEQCSLDDCNLIDFLAFTCDCCHKVFCLEHRGYKTHECPNAKKNDLTVVVCPLCAKGVHLIPEQDPNITWESHVNTDCDPSNYEKVTNKKKCPVRGCKETLTFSNTIKCRDCTIDHCLKHRFGPDHSCPGSKKPEPAFPFWRAPDTKKQDPPPKRSTRVSVPSSSSSSSSSKWASSFLKAASSVKASASSGIAKISNDIGQAFQVKDGKGPSRVPGHGSKGQVEVCPMCNVKFSTVGDLIDHVQKVHETKTVMKATLDVCPKCSKGFSDPVSLVEHVEKEHIGIFKS
ncbi:zinc finger AN1 and C2H2 domain-containing stress-associated protein 13-like [Rutidosis leptorrhynchoides]|uniref:zinc finger AN1 and C2H2 domain-containing stress-associated protein 13-like n=1 Tax=Rutidosis leptorrhynchoides TaxID=125765 RepID=UPI003A994754